jgi:hypothetical protein
MYIAMCLNVENFDLFLNMQLVVLPSELLKRHNIFSGNSELRVGEGTWFVEVNYNQYLDYGWFTKGWQEFVRECNVKIGDGDTCLFEMIDVQNHVFKGSIIPFYFHFICWIPRTVVNLLFK